MGIAIQESKNLEEGAIRYIQGLKPIDGEI